MKKLLLPIFCSIIIGNSALAQTFKVEAITPFNTENPPKTIQVRALDEIQLTPKIKINSGDIINAKLIDIKDPKRLKRDATFKMELNTLTTADGKNIKLKNNNIAKYVPNSKLDKKEVAKSAALSVGNHFIEGFSYGYRAIEGAINSEEDGFGNRTKSAAKHVYEKSSLSYINKGHEVDIQTGDVFGLKLRSNDETEELKNEIEPNYTYEMPSEN